MLHIVCGTEKYEAHSYKISEELIRGEWDEKINYYLKVETPSGWITIKCFSTSNNKNAKKDAHDVFKALLRQEQEDRDAFIFI